MKKGRHRRYEEARALKRTTGFDFGPSDEPCEECGGLPGEHKSWCQLAEFDETNLDLTDPASLFPS